MANHVAHTVLLNNQVNLLFFISSDIGTQQEKDARTAKALDMSLHYGFVTPVTSMVVTKPETEEGAGSPLIADKLTEGKEMLIH